MFAKSPSVLPWQAGNRKLMLGLMWIQGGAVGFAGADADCPESSLTAAGAKSKSPRWWRGPCRTPRGDSFLDDHLSSNGKRARTKGGRSTTTRDLLEHKHQRQSNRELTSLSISEADYSRVPRSGLPH